MTNQQYFCHIWTIPRETYEDKLLANTEHLTDRQVHLYLV